jgi:hypothetical protein
VVRASSSFHQLGIMVCNRLSLSLSFVAIARDNRAWWGTLVGRGGMRSIKQMHPKRCGTENKPKARPNEAGVCTPLSPARQYSGYPAYININDTSIEFPQSQVRASKVIPTEVLQGTCKKCVRYTKYPVTMKTGEIRFQPQLCSTGQIRQ